MALKMIKLFLVGEKNGNKPLLISHLQRRITFLPTCKSSVVCCCI
jgi:hypothetical protein